MNGLSTTNVLHAHDRLLAW